jgi:hypothetical protein
VRSYLAQSMESGGARNDSRHISGPARALGPAWAEREVNVCAWTYLFRRLPTDAAELEQLAQRLGVSLFGTAESWAGHTALLSAIASAFSALAAWRALLLHH